VTLLLLAAVPLLSRGLGVAQVDKENARRAWRATTSILRSISVTVPHHKADQENTAITVHHSRFRERDRAGCHQCSGACSGSNLDCRTLSRRTDRLPPRWLGHVGSTIPRGSLNGLGERLDERWRVWIVLVVFHHFRPTNTLPFGLGSSAFRRSRSVQRLSILSSIGCNKASADVVGMPAR
jgi:hypothetical protein